MKVLKNAHVYLDNLPKSEMYEKMLASCLCDWRNRLVLVSFRRCAGDIYRDIFGHMGVLRGVSCTATWFTWQSAAMRQGFS